MTPLASKYQVQLYFSLNSNFLSSPFLLSYRAYSFAYRFLCKRISALLLNSWIELIHKHLFVIFQRTFLCFELFQFVLAVVWLDLDFFDVGLAGSDEKFIFAWVVLRLPSLQNGMFFIAKMKTIFLLSFIFPSFIYRTLTFQWYFHFCVFGSPFCLIFHCTCSLEK